jgi:hypothetical protein
VVSLKFDNSSMLAMAELSIQSPGGFICGVLNIQQVHPTKADVAETVRHNTPPPLGLKVSVSTLARIFFLLETDSCKPGNANLETGEVERPIISDDPQTRKRCIACPPTWNPTAALSPMFFTDLSLY